MSCLLDTSTCVQLMSNRFPDIRRRMLEASLQAPLYLSSIVVYELQFGVWKSVVRSRSQAGLNLFLSEFTAPLPFDIADAEAAGKIRAHLESRKEPIGPYDTLIAGQALARGLKLITANTREFPRVLGLYWEDWSS